MQGDLLNSNLSLLVSFLPHLNSVKTVITNWKSAMKLLELKWTDLLSPKKMKLMSYEVPMELGGLHTYLADIKNVHDETLPNHSLAQN